MIANEINVFVPVIFVGIALVISITVDWIVRRRIQRWADARERIVIEAVAIALGGQFTFWTLFLIFQQVANRFLAESTITAIQPLLDLAGIMAITILIVRLITNLVDSYLRHRQIGNISLIQNLLRGLGALAVGGTLLISYGVPLSPVLTVIAGSSLGLTLALREPLANFFAGVQIIVSNRVKPGDYIRLASGEEGFVTDIRWSDTYIRQLANNIIIIPNAQMITQIVTNFSRPEPELAVLVDVAVSADADLAHTEAIALEVAREVLTTTTGGVTTFEPLVRFNAVDATGIRFTVVLRGQSFTDQFLLRHEFIKRFHTRLQHEGIATPTHMVRLFAET
ncbi:MAG: mechanosensitive ion channel protein MscS [Chloroflexus sp.]|uniref:mechanosensitive ion channel family protein n=1 Tax=Chloroflexus sp. TaxID=1904827 RepID=UPI0021DBB362|nr:mechanosensitive ion channel family protein [Chloroflexus sp.]GIV91239.1 MAG: mechanosensitive ion channel protein MscS [Chloroflexus sp.]